MRRFYTDANIRLISAEEVDVIKKQVQEGDPVACYKMAQLDKT